MNVSAGSLWFAMLEGEGNNMVIQSWKFSGESTTKHWTPGHKLPILEMWEHSNYRSLELKRAKPEIVFMHPTLSEVIYLLEEPWLFSVDLTTGVVLPIVQLSSEEHCKLGGLSAQKRFFAWQLKWKPWVTLASATLCVPAYKDCIVLAKRFTPRPSQIFYGPACLERKPEYLYVAGTDPSGMILLCSGYRRQGRAAVQKVYLLMDHKAAPDHKPAPGRGILRLPDQSQDALRHGSVGLICKNGNRYVAEFVPGTGGRGIINVWTSLAPEKWNHREVNNSLSSGHAWNGNGVIGWNDALWWVDLSQGLVCYNLFAEQSKVRFLAFPAGSQVAATDVGGPILERRFVNVSEGFLR
jgi:hypothetical protein